MADSADVEHYLIGALLAIPTTVVRRRVAAALAAHGFADYRLTYQVVFQWLGPEGSRVTDLAQHTGITKQAMGEAIAELERRGYVERVPDPTDGRAKLVRRTERGWEVNRVARQVVEEIQAEWVAALGEEDFALLLQQLRRLVRLLNEPADVAGHPRTVTRQPAEGWG